MIIVANTKHVNGYEQVGAFGAWVQGRGEWLAVQWLAQGWVVKLYMALLGHWSVTRLGE